MVSYILRLSFVRKGTVPWLQKQGSDGSSNEILIDCSLRWSDRKTIRIIGAKEIAPRVFMLRPKPNQKFMVVTSGKGKEMKRYKFAIGESST